MKIKSWEDVDEALGIIGYSQGIIAEHRGLIDHEKEVIAEIEPRIEAFTREHEDELQERSKSLVHGRVWLRQATKLVAKSWAKVVERIEGTWRAELFLRVKNEPNKEAMAEATDTELAEIGVKRKTDDVFGYEAS